MLRPRFDNGVMACPKCNSGQFWIQFRETISHRFNATDGQDGWLETEALEGNGLDPIEGIVCYECDIDLMVTKEAKEYIRKMEGVK